jgi:chromosome transmission fidelity protein 4
MLAFNMIGVIDVTDQETHHVINVEFHDKNSRRGYHFQDHSKYAVAALGERGIVYAAVAEVGHPAVIHYRAYDAWASQSDWQVNLPEGEDVVLVASGGRYLETDFDDDVTVGSVVVATTKGYIRFFSGSGLQRYIWRMGEELVSMVAGKDLLFLVHREGGTSLDGCQNLRYTIIDLVSFDVVQDGRLPLPKRTTLSWVGFAEYGVSSEDAVPP